MTPKSAAESFLSSLLHPRAPLNYRAKNRQITTMYPLPPLIYFQSTQNLADYF